MIEKIKINMMSGASVEKPLVTAFANNLGEFVVFDNEMKGTMGHPIILVSKIVNNKLTLINDNEWNTVKENLRMIIAGNQANYIKVMNELSADDVFFKQLSLAEASFDALKNNYKPIEIPVMPEITPVEPMEQFTPNEGLVEPGMPVMPQMPMPTPEVSNMAPEPVMPTPVMPSAPIQNQSVAEVNQTMNTVTPNVEPIPEVENTPVDFTADKEAFLKACENMFDALVAKFNNK